MAARINMEIKFDASLKIKHFLTTYGTTNLTRQIKHNYLTYKSIDKIKMWEKYVTGTAKLKNRTPTNTGYSEM